MDVKKMRNGLRKQFIKEFRLFYTGETTVLSIIDNSPKLTLFNKAVSAGIVELRKAEKYHPSAKVTWYTFKVNKEK